MATKEELKRLRQGPKTPQERIWWDKYSHEKLQAWRYVCDEEADACVRAILRGRPTNMLEEVERRAKTEGGVFKAFLDQCFTVPKWVDFELMEHGRRVYCRFAPLQGLVLLCSSLVEGYAFQKAVQVLVQTGRLEKDVSRRIFETGQMLHNIAGPEGLRPGGIGHRTLMEVRLLHAAVREFISRSGKWDESRFEKPINQEDMAGTVLEFDFMVVRGMKALGLRLSEEERISMHYFWRYAGYLLGVKSELLTESYQEQEVMALQLHSHLYSPTKEGEILAKSLLRDMANKPPFRFPLPVLHAFSRYLIGEELADTFDIRSNVSGRAAVQMVKTATLGMSYGHRLFPDFALKVLEKGALAMGRNALQEGLGNDPARWAFKAMA